jgi:hypothetical protein
VATVTIVMTASTKHVRLLVAFKVALHCVSQLSTHSSAHQPQFMADLFHFYNSIEAQWIAARMKRPKKICEYFCNKCRTLMSVSLGSETVITYYVFVLIYVLLCFCSILNVNFCSFTS